MKKSKLVTGFWLGLENRPYLDGYTRYDRYLGSIIYHAKGFDSVVCYTHQKNYHLVEKIKKDFELNNLEIKIKELSQGKHYEKIDYIANNFPEKCIHLNGRPPEVLYLKLEVLKEECGDDEFDFVYWADAGLQSGQLFPYRFNPHINSMVSSTDEIEGDLLRDVFQTSYKQHDFVELFNQKILDKLATKIEDKILLIVSNVAQSSALNLHCSEWFHLTNLKSYSERKPYHPIAGFFGGDKKKVIEFCDKFDYIVDIFFEHNHMDFEQCVMQFAYDLFPQNDILEYFFEIHCIPGDMYHGDEFHFKKWPTETEYSQKPLYSVWFEMLEEEIR